MPEKQERGEFALSCASRAVDEEKDLDWLHAEIGRFGEGAFWESISALELAYTIECSIKVKSLLHAFVGALIFQHLNDLESGDAFQLLILLGNSASRLSETEISATSKIGYLADAGSCIVRAAEYGELSLKELQYAYGCLNYVRKEGHPDGKDSWIESLAMLARCLCLISTNDSENQDSRQAGENALSILDFLIDELEAGHKWIGKSLEWKALTLVALARTSENPLEVLKEAHGYAISAYAWFESR